MYVYIYIYMYREREIISITVIVTITIIINISLCRRAPGRPPARRDSDPASLSSAPRGSTYICVVIIVYSLDVLFVLHVYLRIAYVSYTLHYTHGRGDRERERECVRVCCTKQPE